jgi:nitrate reductase molybdenum cofactor assembly chaperone
MTESPEHRAIYQDFAALLSYPEPGHQKLAETLASRLREISREASEPLERFAEILASSTVEAAREHYTRAFDLSPLAVPYLSVYLFGAENPQRGQFMAGFSGAYAEVGYDSGGELPDHLATVLGYAGVAPENTWEEVEQLCLPSPLKLMRQALRVGESPYEHVLASLEVFVKHVTAGALIHA